MTNPPEALGMVLEQLLKKLSASESQNLPQYMNTRKAAEYLGLSTQFLEISRCRGSGPKYVKLAQAVRYSKADLDEFMLAHRKHHTAEAGNA
jgi:hypothetical protein